MEYYDLSLAVLVLKFCWSVEDVIYLKVNSQTKSKIELSQKAVENLQKLNYPDYELYNFFNVTLWETIAELGRNRVEDLANIIGKRTMELAEECGKKSPPEKNLADEKCNLYMDHGPSMTRIIQQHMIDEIGQKWKSCSENKSAKNGKESWKDILDKEKFELRLTYSKYFQSSTQFYNPN